MPSPRHQSGYRKLTSFCPRFNLPTKSFSSLSDKAPGVPICSLSLVRLSFCGAVSCLPTFHKAAQMSLPCIKKHPDHRFLCSSALHRHADGAGGLCSSSSSSMKLPRMHQPHVSVATLSRSLCAVYCIYPLARVLRDLSYLLATFPSCAVHLSSRLWFDIGPPKPALSHNEAPAFHSTPLRGHQILPKLLSSPELSPVRASSAP